MQLRRYDTTRIASGILLAHARTLDVYRATLRNASHDVAYTTPESALASPRDAETLARVHTLVNTIKTDALKTVVLVGIGGSDLGARAVYNALGGHETRLSLKKGPRLVAFDTVEPSMLNSIHELCAAHAEPHEIALVIATKSGTTVETITNANALYRALVERFGAGEAAQRTILITDPDTRLATEAQAVGIHHMAMPHAVGGRFSVCTPIGLVPLALLGIDIDALCAGARAAIEASTPDNEPGPAAIQASILFEHYINNIRIHELFLFHPELEMLGKWYRQLLAESIGKERADGTSVGITPTIAIGSIDLHSLGQLVLGGPSNRYTTFVAAPQTWKGGTPCAPDTPFMLDMLHGVAPSDVMQAIYTGVQTTYEKHHLPFNTIEFESIGERDIGAFMGLHMSMVMYLGALFDVDPFTQPDVESYKHETRRLLSSHT